MIEEQLKRKLIELNLAAARKRKSLQTGLVHYFASDPFALKQDAIPVLENFFYVYALFRSKLVENIQEGKEILERLLAFEVDGNFPIALHEFPLCRDKQLSSELLPPLFYLLRDYPLALGEAWTQRLQALSLRIVKGLEKQVEVLSLVAKGRLNAFLGTFVDLLSWQPRTPAEWGEFCICAQMSGLDFSTIATNWDPALFVFVGASRERQQEEYEPAVTLLDLFMGEYFQSFSKRALLSIESPSHLKAALVHPFEKVALEERKKASFRCLLEKSSRQCLTIYWGASEKVHSFVVEAKKGTWNLVEEKEGVISCLYTYDETVPSEEESMELGFYLDDSEDHLIEVAQERATVFHPQDEVTITSKRVKLFLNMQANPEEIQWMGHVLKGDRSFQKGRELPYGGYDWKLGLRTIQRKSAAQILLQVKIEST